MQTTIEIEALIRWAWLEELPKVAPEDRRMVAPAVLGYPSAWSSMTGEGRLGRMGTLNRFGAVWDRGAASEPDPDALRVADEVARLDDLVVAERPEADFFGRWGDLGRLGDLAMARAWDLVSRDLVDSDRSVTRVLQGSASSIVVRVALTGTWPDWDGPRPQAVPEVWPGGAPKWERTVSRAVEWDEAGTPIRFDTVTVDGFDRIARRPYRGAVRVQRLAPDPSTVLAARIRWAMIHLWLTTLAERLDGLGGRVVAPPSRDPAPWS
jgi:hypothetical protein